MSDESTETTPVEDVVPDEDPYREPEARESGSAGFAVEGADEEAEEEPAE